MWNKEYTQIPNCSMYTNDSFRSKSKHSLLCGSRKFVPIELTYLRQAHHFQINTFNLMWLLFHYLLLLHHFNVRFIGVSLASDSKTRRRGFSNSKNRYALSSSAPMGFNSEKFLFHFTSHGRWSRRTRYSTKVWHVYRVTVIPLLVCGARLQGIPYINTYIHSFISTKFVRLLVCMACRLCRYCVCTVQKSKNQWVTGIGEMQA